MELINEHLIVDKPSGLTMNQLKLIAIMTMLIDHIGATILPFFEGVYGSNVTSFFWFQLATVSLRVIGRISFPIFAFLIVNGFYHTSDRKKYLLRLIIFAFLSEPFFDFAFYNSWFELTHQNVFFTLSLGLLAIWGYDNLMKKRQQKFIGGLFVVAIGLMSEQLMTDYSLYGILTIFIMYLFFENKKYLCIVITALNLLIYGGYLFTWASIPSLVHDIYGFSLGGGYGFGVHVLVYLTCIAQLFCLVALWPISKYTGEKGVSKINKYVFYSFYPVHLFILGLILTVLRQYY